MNRYLAFLLLPLAACLLLACGSGNGRQLQSISIAQTLSGQQVQFVATGKFSAAPTVVTPLPVQWTFGLMAPPPKTYTYTLTSQPFLFRCSGSGPWLPIGAYAPPDPSAPASGSVPQVIVAYAVPGCP